ncbi:MAG: hypothetical protein LC659_02770, partial [Myxococcales bacterium]|nr:hypothetical protein [Myxococcales bacterium]
MAPPRRLTLAVAVTLASCAARAPVASAPASPSSASPSSRRAPAIVASNILRRDYAGSKACEGCHADEYDKFMAAPMHNMTRLPSQSVPAAPFDGGVFRFKDDEVRFSTRGGDRLMTIASASLGTRTYRVTRVIGGHYREDFAGVEEGGRDGKTERILPATWSIAKRAWRYKGYSVMGPERPGLRPGGVWNRTCIFCHNTIPYFDDLLGALSDPKIGPYQGEVVDPLLPVERRARYEITDAAALRRAVADELGVIGARPRAQEASDLLRAIRAKFDGSHLVE